MKTLHDFNFKNKKALIRVDFNFPLYEQSITPGNAVIPFLKNIPDLDSIRIQ